MVKWKVVALSHAYLVLLLGVRVCFPSAFTFLHLPLEWQQPNKLMLLNCIRRWFGFCPDYILICLQLITRAGFFVIFLACVRCSFLILMKGRVRMNDFLLFYLSFFRLSCFRCSPLNIRERCRSQTFVWFMVRIQEQRAKVLGETKTMKSHKLIRYWNHFVPSFLSFTIHEGHQPCVKQKVKFWNLKSRFEIVWKTIFLFCGNFQQFHTKLTLCLGCLEMINLTPTHAHTLTIRWYERLISQAKFYRSLFLDSTPEMALSGGNSKLPFGWRFQVNAHGLHLDPFLKLQNWFSIVKFWCVWKTIFEFMENMDFHSPFQNWHSCF